MNSIKGQVTGELKIEMNQPQSDITAYRQPLRDFKQGINFVRLMSRKNTRLLCLETVLGSGMVTATVPLWSGFTLKNQTMTYQDIGKYVHSCDQAVSGNPGKILRWFS